METFSNEHKPVYIYIYIRACLQKYDSMVAYNRVECCFLDKKNFFFWTNRQNEYY